MSGLPAETQAQIARQGLGEIEVQIEQAELKLATLHAARQALAQRLAEIETRKGDGNAEAERPQEEL